MADVYVSLADMVKINDKNANDLGVSDLFDSAPLIKALAAVPASNGTNHSYLKQVSAPGVGFREPNVGLYNTVSADELVSTVLKICDASFTIDAALAESYKGGVTAMLAREAGRHLRAAMFKLEQQVVHGLAADATGFTGIDDLVSLDGPLTDTHLIGAGGTTASTGSSVYLIRSNANDGVAVVAGQEGEIKISPSIEQRVEDSSGRHYAAWFTPINAYYGLQVGSANSIVRIANLTGDSGKGLTDSLISYGLSLFPAGLGPNIIAMGRRSLFQLQNSRTATNPTGAPADYPAETFGIKIVVTDAIGGVESLETAT